MRLVSTKGSTNCPFSPGVFIATKSNLPLIDTPATVTDPDKLRAILGTIRKNGFHLAQDDLDIGAYSIAVPIWGPHGDVVAALSVAGPNARLDPARQDAHLSAAQGAALSISARLGQPAADAGPQGLREISPESADAA